MDDYDDYKDIRELLKPRRDIKASEELRKKVYMALDRKSRGRMIGRWLFGGISLGAVAAVLLLVLVLSGMSAKEILTEAINALRRVESIEMVVEVRTRAVENFRYIDINEDFVTHHIDIAKSDSLLRWRVDKGERVATGSGRDIYTWMPALRLGWHLDGAANESVLGYMANLLAPREILETELENCISSKQTEYKVNKTGSDIILTVHAAPQGNFDNPYLLNSSIAESENVRRYVIDSSSKRLKSVTVSVVSDNREIVVLKMSAISYGRPKDDICLLDDGIKFIETENQPDGLRGLSPEEAASTVLNAFADWDEGVLEKVMAREMSDVTYREKFHGSKLISVGQAFTSGMGNSIFVPYTLEMSDGTLYRHNISLQKTDTGGWVVVGGL